MNEKHEFSSISWIVYIKEKETTLATKKSKYSNYWLKKQYAVKFKCDGVTKLKKSSTKIEKKSFLIFKNKL